MWLKPTEVNDWGYIRVYLVPPSVRKDDPRFYKTVQKYPVVKRAGTCRIVWPDGVEGVFQVVMRAHTESVSEQGHMPETVVSHVPHVVVNWYGAIVHIPLSTPGIRVWGPNV